MRDFLNLQNRDKLQIFEQIRTTTGMIEQAVEKDWWVTQTLRLIFSMSCATHLVFKGGTSLSKGWNLIDRLSEDIDLALDRSYLGFDKPMTSSQVYKLRKASHKFISTLFFDELKAKFSEAGFENISIQLLHIKDIDQDPIIIEINYPSVTGQSDYLHPRVLVEIGSRSLREPFTVQTFTSMVGEHYAGRLFADKNMSIPIVNPERTFLEKIFLLHEEFQKQTHKIRVNRLSRHLYDLEKLMATHYADKALNDNNLYECIVEHRKTLTAIRGIDYNNHAPSKIKIIPPDEVLSLWENDYEIMQKNMIYGESLPFHKLMERIAFLQNKINNIQ